MADPEQTTQGEQQPTPEGPKARDEIIERLKELTARAAALGGEVERDISNMGKGRRVLLVFGSTIALETVGKLLHVPPLVSGTIDGTALGYLVPAILSGGPLREKSLHAWETYQQGLLGLATGLTSFILLEATQAPPSTAAFLGSIAGGLVYYFNEN